MSDDVKNAFKKEFAAVALIDAKQKELKGKKLIIEERRVNSEMDRLVQNDRDLEIAKGTNFGALSDEQIEKLRKDNLDYIEGAKNSMRFINKTFDGIIPFFRKNLILIGGKTGEGKSTTVANIVRETITQPNKKTGKRRKVLVITNEEKSEDVYNRVTCLANGWHYTNHDKFTPEMIHTFDKMIPVLAAGGLLTVVDNTYNGSNGMTTTLEGIQTIFENLIRDNIEYDAVIIDYYQNIKHSKNNPQMNEYEVQALLANFLDRMKNEYAAPIIVMAQVKPPDEAETPFEFRIKGRKVICDPATLIMEMVAHRADLKTEWIIHKSRFTEAIGAHIMTGYDRGRFVEYSVDFQTKVAKIKEERQLREATQGTEDEKPEQKEETHVERTKSN